jgi:hypothetical protein
VDSIGMLSKIAKESLATQNTVLYTAIGIMYESIMLQMEMEISIFKQYC